jgi:hypothetical protein
MSATRAFKFPKQPHPARTGQAGTAKLQRAALNELKACANHPANPSTVQSQTTAHHALGGEMLRSPQKTGQMACFFISKRSIIV